ncbi:MAG: PLP-dependent transferase [Geminicoccaceae bacterium]|nr:PLP-dependent transferase [Geminicoccaceae bacterium]
MTGQRDIATLLVQDDLASGPVVPPIHQSSLFTFDDVAQMAATFAGENDRPVYSRGNNPTVRVFEQKMAMLEGGEAARGFASGMAAISASILAFAQSGDRIVCVRHVYPDTYRFMRRLLPRLGIETSFVDGRDLDAMRKALDGAALLYLESPTSVVFETHDIAEQARLAREAGAVSIIDNSWATPVFQRPLALGVDIVVHSASKYVSGHSDTVAGVAIGARERIDRINTLTYPFLGGKLAPFEAWLLLRGLRTLTLRLRRHDESVTRVAGWLQAREEVERVHLPEISNRPGGLSGRAGLFSIELRDGVDPVRFCDALDLFRLGVSWGGHESLCFPMAVGLRQAGEHNSLVDFGVPQQLVRLHVGLEEPDDLMADLDRAFATVNTNIQGSP